MTQPHALITGGSGGIGSAIATRLAQDGYRLTLVSRDAQPLEDTVARLRSAGHQADGIFMDLSDWSSGAALAGRLGPQDGLDLLVHCSGGSQRGALAELTESMMVEGMSSKLYAAASLTAALWPRLVVSHGQVISIVGALARTPSPDSLVGSAVCGAFHAFMKGVAEQGRRDGVRVNCVHPGWIDTGRLESQLKAIAAREGHDDLNRARESLLRELKITRIGQPDDVAQAIAFLASSRSGFIHGTSIDIDGGLNKSL